MGQYCRGPQRLINADRWAPLPLLLRKPNSSAYLMYTHISSCMLWVATIGSRGIPAASYWIWWESLIPPLTLRTPRLPPVCSGRRPPAATGSLPPTGYSEKGEWSPPMQYLSSTTPSRGPEILWSFSAKILGDLHVWTTRLWSGRLKGHNKALRVYAEFVLNHW
jgi:hypothetical protein